MRVWTCKELRVKPNQISCYLRPPFLGTPLVPSREKEPDKNRGRVKDTIPGAALTGFTGFSFVCFVGFNGSSQLFAGIHRFLFSPPDFSPLITFQGHGNHVGRFTHRGCTGMLVHAHVLHVLGFGFNACDKSTVIVRKCKCTDCTGMVREDGS